MKVIGIISLNYQFQDPVASIKRSTLHAQESTFTQVYNVLKLVMLTIFKRTIFEISPQSSTKQSPHFRHSIAGV